MSEYYIGTRRGRSVSGDMGYEMFPEKYESSEHLLYEDPDLVHDDHRDTLKDFTPDNATLFESDEPRRNYGSVYRMNIRDHGTPKSGTDPWRNEDFDIQFHDKDPRGFLTEQPWNEYRRHIEAQLRRIDFKDDGDYSTTSGGVHPNTLYKNIRSAQAWVKSRMKIFSTSYESRHNGGVGVYSHVSNVFKSDQEDSSVLTDGTGMSTTFEDPVVRQRITTRLSNILHGGSAALRANTTTDHRVKVASYGKLYSQRGLIPHESQLRIIEDDTPWSKIEQAQGVVPKNLVKLMANTTNGTSAQANRENAQVSAGVDIKLGNRADKMENRNNVVTGDILALLGITQNEVKFLESYRGKNRKSADLMLANMYEMTELVHRMPLHEKLQARTDLLLKSAGGGLLPATASQIRGTRDHVVVNPKIIEFMYSVVAKGKPITSDDQWGNRLLAEADAENRQEINNPTKNTPLFVFKNAGRTVEEVTESMWNSTPTPASRKPVEKMAHSYAALKHTSSAYSANRKDTRVTQDYSDADYIQQGKNFNMGEEDQYGNMREGQVTTRFGQDRFFDRHVAGGNGSMSNKSGIRRNMDTDFFSYDTSNERGTHDMLRKNPKNAE
jgi:hypothetical protein